MISPVAAVYSLQTVQPELQEIRLYLGFCGVISSIKATGRRPQAT